MRPVPKTYLGLRTWKVPLTHDAAFTDTPDGGIHHDLTTLVGSRVYHDLVNPLGAIGNGLELLDMTGMAKGPELELIRDALTDAQARLRFFRFAFGAIDTNHSISVRDVRGAFEERYQKSRITPQWNIDDDLPRAQVKLGFLMALCAEAALPMGADMRLVLDPKGHLRLEAEASRTNVDVLLWAVLRHGTASLARGFHPNEAQFPALYALCDTLGLTLNYVADENSLTISTDAG